MLDTPAKTDANIPVIETELLQTVVAIAETGNFSRAAEQVFRTPSAVSMQIKKLETLLGRTLFIRDSRSVVPTPDGEFLIGYARRILRLNNEAMRHFRMPEVEGMVRFGTPDDFGIRLLPPILSRFAASHCGVQVDVTLEMSVKLLEKLAAGELDATLVTEHPRKPVGDGGEVVFVETLSWAGLQGGCAHEYPVLPLALSDIGCSWRSCAIKALDATDRDYHIAYSSPHCAGQEAAILADLAVAPFPVSLIKPPLQRLGSREGLPDLGTYQISLYCASNMTSAAKAFAEHVRETLRELQ